MAIQLIVGQGVTHNRIFLRKCPRWSIQTDPKKGWFTYLRLYGPLEPFFTKEWRPSEVELVP
jgi:hypothetical protein